MHMKQKIFRSALAVIIGASMVLTGCGSNGKNNASTSAGKGDNSEPVVLTWYYPDDPSPHTDIMWEELNKYLTEKINVVVDYKIVPWGEYATKTNTIKSAGQEFDIMFESGSYVSAVNQGVAQPITEYLDTVGKEMQEAIPESIWKAATVDGEIYGVPTYKDSAAVWGIVYNKTIADEAGIEIPENIDMATEGLEAFYREAKEKVDAHYGPDNDILITRGFPMIDPFETLHGRIAVANVSGDPMFAGRQPGEVFSSYGEPEVLEYLQMIRGLIDDKIYPLDAENMDVNPYKQDGTLFAEMVMGYVDFPIHGWSNDYETAFIPADNTYMTTLNATFGTNIVGINSKNVEKAVELLNLLNTDNYVANTIRFGIEGEYYNVTEDNRLDFTGTLNEDPSARTYYRWYGWQFGNIFAMSLPLQENDALFEKLEEANEKALPADHIGFVPDTSNIVNELATISAVTTKYETNLIYGMIEDVEGNLASMNAELEAAGLPKVLEEIQKQVNEWRAANGLPVFEQ